MGWRNEVGVGMRVRWVMALLALVVAMPVGTVLAEVGSREEPVPFGTAHKVEMWSVTVIAVNRDAAEFLASTFPAAKDVRPAEGNVFVLVRVAAEYIGRHEAARVGDGLTESAVGPSRVAYDAHADCPAYPDRASSAPEVFPGGVVEVNYCWEVAREDADALLLYFLPVMQGDGRIFFSLDEPEGTPVASPEGTPAA